MPPRFAPVALGSHSPVLERARALRDRDGRRAAGRFLIEGPTLLADALDAGRVPAAVYGTPVAYAALAPAVRSALAAAGTNAFEVAPTALARLSELESPPGIVAELALVLVPPDELFAAAATGDAPVAILAGLADPGNAGTLLRSAEIFGIRHVAFAEGGVEPYHPKVVRAAMGGHFRSAIAFAPGPALLAAAAASGYVVIAADTGGEDLPGFTFPRRSAVAIGSERHGAGRALPAWDRSVRIPHAGAGESLNAAIAGSIIFYSLSQSRSV